MSWIDDFVGFFSPQAKVSRLRAKAVARDVENYLRKYEGASKGRRTAGWRTTSASAKSEIKPALSTLRNRSRDLVRNNSYAEKGIRAIATETIGKGIKASIQAPSSRAERQLLDLWSQWTDSRLIDIEGTQTFCSIQNLIMRSMAESGEVLIRKRRVRPTQSNPFPIRLQVLESDFIDSDEGSFRTKTGSEVIQGIEFDENGGRLFYHLFEDHPGNFNILQSPRIDSIRVPASDVLHIFRVDRPGQIRGVPWLAPAMIRLRDLDEFSDAQLVRQKVAAMFTAFIKDMEPLSDGLSEDQRELCEKMEPGSIEFLPPGKDIILANPPGVENYKEYTSVLLHEIASGLGVPFEALTQDLSQVNFSSARLGWLQFQRNIDSWRSQILIPSLLNPVFDWFLEGADLLGVNTQGAFVEWTPPRREMIDPTKEIPAIIDGIRGGIITLSEAIRQQGKDPESHLEEIARDNQTLDELELTLDSDPRKINGSGAQQRVS